MLPNKRRLKLATTSRASTPFLAPSSHLCVSARSVQGQAVANGRCVLQALEFAYKISWHGKLVCRQLALGVARHRLVHLEGHCDQVGHLQKGCGSMARGANQVRSMSIFAHTCSA